MNIRRFVRFAAIASPVVLLGLLAQGCAVHAHPHYGYDAYEYDQYDEYDEYDSGYVEPAPSYGYHGGHVIPDVYGGGWCFLDGPHYHEYAPDYLGYYRFRAGFYVYTGPVSFFFFGFHPVPVIHGGGYCRLSGRHVHHYHPHFADHWRYHPTRRYYYWSDRGRAPARGWHPAEPAYRDHHPRVHDVRPARDRPTPGMVARPARPATRTPPGGRPGTGRPVTDEGRARRGVAPGGEPGAPAARPARPALDCDATGRCVDPQPSRGRDVERGEAHRGGGNRPAEVDRGGRTPRSRTVLDLGPVEGTGGPAVDRAPELDRRRSSPSPEESWGRGRLTPPGQARDRAKEPEAAPRRPFERPSTPSRVERPSTPSRVERPSTPSRAERPSTPSRAERPSAPSRAERPSAPSRAERPSTPSRVERPSAPSHAPRTRPAPRAQTSERKSSSSRPRASERKSSSSRDRASDRKSSSSRRSPRSRRPSRPDTRSRR